jgi:hypothetical protein
MVVVGLVTLPLVFCKMRPCCPLVVDERLVNVIVCVVEAMDSAAPPVALTEPVGTVIVPLLFADMPGPPLVVTASDMNEIAPVFVARFTPAPLVEFLFTVVAPKLNPPIIPVVIVQF